MGYAKAGYQSGANFEFAAANFRIWRNIGKKGAWAQRLSPESATRLAQHREVKLLVIRFLMRTLQLNRSYPEPYQKQLRVLVAAAHPDDD
jgi:hypothetical protein